MKTRTFLISAAVAAFLVAGVGIHHAAVPRVVGRAVAPEGTEMCVGQEFNWSSEPFTTSFLYRQAPGQWNRHYYDHQDRYWGRSRAVLDPATQNAVFYRDGTPAVTFNWATATYTLHRWKRVETEPGWQQPAGWTPTQPVYKR